MSVAKRLQHEIKASPAKAGALGLLLIVAAYFWLPTVVGLIGTGKQAPPAPSADQATSTASTTPAASAGNEQQPTAKAFDYDWRMHAKSMDEDPLARPVDALSNERDPFASNETLAAAEPLEPPAAPPVVVEPMTPQDAGLVLSTTLHGARMKIADIGGKSYTIGDRIEVSGNGADTSFQVVEIHQRRVVLKSDGKLYELKIPRPLVDAVVEARTGRTDHAPAHDDQPPK
jgi:hypothetical protein